MPNASPNAHLPTSPYPPCRSDPQAPRQGVRRQRHHHVALHRVQLRPEEPLATVPARRQRVLSLDRDAATRRLLPGALTDALVHDDRAVGVRAVHQRRERSVRRLLQAQVRRRGQRHAVRQDPPPRRPKRPPGGRQSEKKIGGHVVTRVHRPRDHPMERPARRRPRAGAQQPGATGGRCVRAIVGSVRGWLRRDRQPRRRD